MWIQTSITMKQRGRTDVVGEDKAILELAYAMNEQLEKPGEAAMLALSKDALESRVERDVGGGTISYGTKLLHNSDGHAERGFRTLLRKEMWCSLAILVALALDLWCLIVSKVRTSFFWVFVGFWISVAVALSVGSSGRRRAFIFLWLLFLTCFVPLWRSVLLDIMLNHQLHHPDAQHQRLYFHQFCERKHTSSQRLMYRARMPLNCTGRVPHRFDISPNQSLRFY
jgi:hypothetical protein